MRHFRVEAVRKEVRAAVEKRIDELKTEIKARMVKAESGADWADICALEVELVGLGGSY